jgi:prepilin-type N-terminal cleavage/methylation domain-containing protein
MVGMKQKKNSKQQGFTLVELMLVIGITAVLALVSMTYLLGRRGGQELDGTTRHIVALLKEAQSKSLSFASSSAWGVHFQDVSATNTTAFYALFANSYATATTVGFYRLPNSVIYASSTNGWNSLDVVFGVGTGVPTTGASIKVQSISSANISSTIIVATSTGVVSF